MLLNFIFYRLSSLFDWRIIEFLRFCAFAPALSSDHDTSHHKHYEDVYPDVKQDQDDQCPADTVTVTLIIAYKKHQHWVAHEVESRFVEYLHAIQQLWLERTDRDEVAEWKERLQKKKVYLEEGHGRQVNGGRDEEEAAQKEPSVVVEAVEVWGVQRVVERAKTNGEVLKAGAEVAFEEKEDEKGCWDAQDQCEKAENPGESITWSLMVKLIGILK